MILLLQVACVSRVVELEPAAVTGSGDALEVLIAEGQLVQPDGRGGLERLPVEAPTRATLFEDGRLMGTSEGRSFFARLEGGRPYVWLLPEQWLDVGSGYDARVYEPTPVPVLGFEDDQVHVALPFEAPDGGPVTTSVARSGISAARPDPAVVVRSVAVHGRLEHDRRVVVLGAQGQPIAITACGSVRFGGTAEVMQLREGIELAGDLGPPGPPCPERAGAPTAGLTDPPEGWHTATRPADERIAFTEALFTEGAELFTAEPEGCVRWTVEPGEFGPELARRWQDDTFRYRESIGIGGRGDASVTFARRFVERERFVRAAVESVQGRPVKPCGEIPVSIVDWDEGEVRMVRVYNQGAAIWAWPPDRPVERLYRSQSACERRAAVLEASAGLPGAGGCG